MLGVQIIKYLQVETGKPIPKFGAAADGDADRNMILSSQLPGSVLKDLGFRVRGYRFFDRAYLFGV